MDFDSGHQLVPVVAPRIDGGGGIAFQNAHHADNTGDPNSPNITYRTFSVGGALGPNLAIGDFNLGSGHNQLINPAIATLSTGRQVVVFERIFSAGTDDDIFLNVVNAAGTATQFTAASPLLVEGDTNWQANPAVAANGNQALVVYEDATGTTIGSANIRARLFDGGSNTVGAA